MVSAILVPGDVPGAAGQWRCVACLSRTCGEGVCGITWGGSDRNGGISAGLFSTGEVPAGGSTTARASQQCVGATEWAAARMYRARSHSSRGISLYQPDAVSGSALSDLPCALRRDGVVDTDCDGASPNSDQGA